MVIAFDGQWGSGKTTFLKMWAGELRKAGIPCIFFDAFENDYVEDAFAALVREISTLIENQQSVGEVVAASFRERAVELGKLLGKAGLKLGLKVAVRTATASMLDGLGPGLSVEDISASSDEVAEQYMQDLLAASNKQKETVKSFRELLSGIPEVLAPPSADDTQRPLVFIIDELDRCKPHFALQILERVKHFFNVPNIHFVLGVHSRQLESSVRAAYGSDVDAATYLQKFITLKVVNADSGVAPHQRRVSRYLSHLKKAYDFSDDDHHLVESASNFILRVALSNSLSLRTVERIFSHFVLCVAFTNKHFLRPGPIVGGLCVLKVTSSELFTKAKTGLLTIEEAVEAFGIDKGVTVQSTSSEEREWQWWQYCLLKELPKDFPDWGSQLWRYNFGSRSSILPAIANDVVDRLQTP